MCLYIIMPFSSNFYLFVFGNVIENRMTMPPKTNTRRQNKKTPSRSPKFFSNFAPTLLQQFKMFLQLLSL